MVSLAAGLYLVAEDTRRVFLAKRSRHVNSSGVWAAIGGSVHKGEDPWDAVLREFKEETGFRGDIINYGELAYWQSEDGKMKFRSFVGTTLQEFEARLNWENSACGWFNYGDWPSPLHPIVKDLLMVVGTPKLKEACSEDVKKDA